MKANIRSIDFSKSFIKTKKVKLSHHFALSGKIVGGTKNDQKKRSASHEILENYREGIRREKAEKVKLQEALAKKPAGVKLQVDKSGNYYIQPRDSKGRLCKRVNL